VIEGIGPAEERFDLPEKLPHRPPGKEHLQLGHNFTQCMNNSDNILSN